MASLARRPRARASGRDQAPSSGARLGRGERQTCKPPLISSVTTPFGHRLRQDPAAGSESGRILVPRVPSAIACYDGAFVRAMGAGSWAPSERYRQAQSAICVAVGVQGTASAWVRAPARSWLVATGPRSRRWRWWGRRASRSVCLRSTVARGTSCLCTVKRPISELHSRQIVTQGGI